MASEIQDSFVDFAQKTWGKPLEEIFETTIVQRAPSTLPLDDPVPTTITVLHTELTFPTTIMIRNEYLTALRAASRKIHKDHSAKSDEQAGRQRMSAQDMFDSESLVRPIDADLSYEEWLQTPPTLQDIKDANPFTKNETPPSSRSSFIVSGPPGVGKTLWLYFVLALRSSARLPTVLQLRQSSYIFFYAGSDGSGRVSNRRLSQETNFVGMTYHRLLGPECWWLVDAPSDIFPPPDNILNSRLPIIQAASPREGRVEWGKKRGADTFFMRTWSRVELICARMLQDDAEHIDETAIQEFLEDHIASARLLFTNYDRLVGLKHDVKESLLGVTHLELQAFTRTGGNTSDKVFSHRVFALVPQKDRLATPVLVIPTAFLRECVESALAKRAEDDLQYYFQLCSSVPLYSTIAGAILEDRMHRYFPMGGDCKIYSMDASNGPKNRNFAYVTGSPFLKETIPQRNPYEFRKLDPKILFLRDDIYYRPTGSNFPTLDAFTYETRTQTVTILQSTMSAKHDLKAGPLLTLRDEFEVKAIRCIIWTPLSHDKITISVPEAAKSLVKTVDCLEVDMEKIQRKPHFGDKNTRFFS